MSTTQTTAVQTAALRLQSGVMIPVRQIERSPLNPRTAFNPDLLKELGESLKQSQVEDIIVRPHPTKEGFYELADGERRWRAAKLAGIEELRANVDALSDQQVREVGLITFIQKEGLNPIDEAQAYRSILAIGSLTVEDIAQRIGKGRSKKYVYDRVKLLDSIELVAESLVTGEMSAGHAILFARLPPADQANELKWYRHRITQGMACGVRELDAHLDHTVRRLLSKATFPPSDAALVPEAGSCMDCPKREAGSKRGELGKCLDQRCFSQKTDAFIQVGIAKLTEEKRPFFRLSTSYYESPDVPAGALTANKWREALGKEANSRVGIIVHGENRGKTLEIVLNSEENKRQTKEAARQKELKRRAKIERAVRLRTLQEIGPKIGEVALSPNVARTIQALAKGLAEVSRQEETMLELHGQPARKPGEKGWRGPKKRFEALVAKVLKAKPLQLLAELLLAGGTAVTAEKPPEAFQTLAGLYRVDMKRLRKEETAKLAPKKKAGRPTVAKKKTAKKKDKTIPPVPVAKLIHKLHTSKKGEK